jgi:hypothetical protein
MENKFQEPPQYNQINSPAGQSQFVAQPSYGQPVIVQQTPQPVIVNAVTYGPEPMTVTCFHCRATVTTTTTESPNAMCCFLFGCWALCCPGCQDVEHRCPNCNVILGTFKP